MLKLEIVMNEMFDEETDEFVSDKFILELEHSLVSLSKWESKYEKPFLTASEKTVDEIIDYIRMMVLTPEVPEEVIDHISSENLEEINTYLNAKMTATWFSEVKTGPPNREVVTSELIYYWLIAYQIPFSTETWNLNRLFTLIKVCGLKNEKPKKMSRSELIARNRALNEQRKAQWGTKG